MTVRHFFLASLSRVQCAVKSIYYYGVLAAARSEIKRDFVPKGLTWLAFFLEGVDRVSDPGGKWTCKKARVRKLVSNAVSIDLALTFQGTGGASDYLTRQAREAPKERLVLVVKATNAEKALMVEAWLGNALRDEFFVEGLSAFKSLPAKKMRMIVVNELISWHRYFGFPAMSEKGVSLLVAEILSLRNKFGCGLLYLVHDYFAICPRYSLLTRDLKYCRKEITGEVCDNCVKLGFSGFAAIAPKTNVERWRKSFGELLAQADEVRTFSEDSSLRMRKIFPRVKVNCVPHQPLIDFARKPLISKEGTTIGVFGNVSLMKGAGEVVNLAKFLHENKQAEARIVVVGDLSEIGKVFPPNLKVLGRYERDALPDIIEREGINVAFCSTVCPETFSYVTQELMFLDLPIVCYDFGAQRERVAKYEKGRVVSVMTSEAVWDAIVSLRSPS